MEEGRNVGFERWGVGALDELLGAWDGIGVMEVSGPQRTGKSVSYPAHTDPSRRCRYQADGRVVALTYRSPAFGKPYRLHGQMAGYGWVIHSGPGTEYTGRVVCFGELVAV